MGELVERRDGGAGGGTRLDVGGALMGGGPPEPSTKLRMNFSFLRICVWVHRVSVGRRQEEKGKPTRLMPCASSCPSKRSQLGSTLVLLKPLSMSKPM